MDRIAEVVSFGKLVLGTSPISGHGWSYDENSFSAQEILIKSVELGYRSFDTADCYGLGNAEKEIGKLLETKILDREKLFITSKGGVAWNSSGKTWKDSSPKYLEFALKESLRRLKTDYIDAYLVHWRDQVTPWEDSLQALRKLQAAGHIRFIGVSNISLAELEHMKDGLVEVVQIRGNLLETGLLAQIKPYCDFNNIVLQAHSVLADGLLSGKITSDHMFPDHDHRSRLNIFKSENLTNALLKFERFQEFAKKLDIPLSALAISWILSSQLADTAIVGTRSIDNLITNLIGAQNRIPVERVIELLIEISMDVEEFTLEYIESNKCY